MRPGHSSLIECGADEAPGRRLIAEWRWPDDLDSGIFLGGVAKTVQVDGGFTFQILGRGNARAPIEGLGAGRRLQAKDSRDLRGDQERVGETAGEEGDTARPDAALVTRDVDEDLALQHVEKLVLVGMDVKRSGLTRLEEVLEQEQGPARLLGTRLPDMDAAPEEPDALPLPVVANDRNRCTHLSLLSVAQGAREDFMELTYHEGMKVPYEKTGRVHQKARTRGALTDAARELLAQGVPPTVEGAAKAASVSRTTAYRYFPNQWALVAAAFPHVDEDSMLGPDATNDPLQRLETVAQALTRRVLTHEAEMRAVLKLSLEGIRPAELPMHRGLRIGWVEDALRPLAQRLEATELSRLAYGISATLGIEAFVWLTDIGQLSREESASVMRSNASRLLESALAEISNDR